jgi:hypothetical protein
LQRRNLNTLFIFGGTGIWTQSFVLAKQALYHLRYNHSPFCSGYFGHRVLLFAQVSLDPDPPILGFLLLPGWQAHASMPSFWLTQGLSNFYPPGLPGTAVLSISASHIVWGACHHTQLLFEIGVLLIFLPVWPPTLFLPISSCQVATIIGMSHQYPA